MFEYSNCPFLTGELFWQNNSLVTHIVLFELETIIIFSTVANFGDQSLCSGHFFQFLNTTMNFCVINVPILNFSKECKS